MTVNHGDIWLLNLDPTVGREPRGTRPGLVISVDKFNQGPTELVIVLPVTSKKKNTPFHIEIDPPEGGVKTKSFIKCEDIRSVSKNRLLSLWGSVSPQTMEAVKDRLRILLDM